MRFPFLQKVFFLMVYVNGPQCNNRPTYQKRFLGLYPDQLLFFFKYYFWYFLFLNLFLFNFILIFYINIYFIIGCSIAVCGLSLVAASGGYSSLQCVDFSLQWLLVLWSTGCRSAGFSSCGTQAPQLWLAALERRLSSCCARAQLLHSMWDLPSPGLEPVSPALAGGVLTTVPPGKPQDQLLAIHSTHEKK